MELRINARGHRVATMSERRQILDKIQAGMSPAEAARRYELAMWTVKRWMKLDSESSMQAVASTEGTSADPSVPISEFKRLQEELAKSQEDLKATRKSLARMTVNRDILQEAVEIARKKKWI